MSSSARCSVLMLTGKSSCFFSSSSVASGVPHQLCQFHDLREAERPIYEIDRHAKKELKKRVRGIKRKRRLRR